MNGLTCTDVKGARFHSTYQKEMLHQMINSNVFFRVGRVCSQHGKDKDTILTYISFRDKNQIGAHSVSFSLLYPLSSILNNVYLAPLEEKN